MTEDVRWEEDSMGRVAIPTPRLYGASTRRAVDNFPISGVSMPKAVIAYLALIKRAAAHANKSLGLLDPALAGLIERAAVEIEEGLWDAEFPVDVFQTGSGTSSNMNVNEVIANRCAQLANQPVGKKTPVHPNDHVNLGQSSNDVFPTAIHLAAMRALRDCAAESARLSARLAEKAKVWDRLIKIGRTHLQDATPLTLGQEFSGYQQQMAKAAARLARCVETLAEVPIGGTAVGTGLNCHPQLPRLVCDYITAQTGLACRPAENHFETQAAKDALVEVSGVLKTIAVSLSKIANDIRLLGSGPRCGFGELVLPAVQPGSSIMPGKVNPVICESVIQVCVQVIGNDAALTLAGFGGVGSILELNVAMPVMARNLLESITLLANAMRILGEKAVADLAADEARCAELVEMSLALVTRLATVIGYDRAAQLAKQAHQESKSIRAVAAASGLLSTAELDQLLDPTSMV